MNMLERSILLVPGARPVSVAIASVPLPLTPGTAPISVSAVEVMLPPTLSMVPGTKNVAPPPGRNEPSTMETAERVPGAKLKSNWKAYRSVKFESVVTFSPASHRAPVGTGIQNRRCEPHRGVGLQSRTVHVEQMVVA
jgi:hypothetical protein